MKTIKIENLKKYYGNNRGVENVSFEVNEGEMVGFVGPNGAGKSTVIRVLMGLISKTSGRVLILDEEPSSKINEMVGYLPSEVFLYSELSVLKQLIYFANIRNVSIARIEELAGYLDLDLNKKIKDLSFGNKKKVGIVAAMIHSPKVLILDEPTTGLDPLIQQRFFKLLEEEKNKGVSILLSSHVLNEVEKACDKICLIKDGKTIFTDSLNNLKDSQFKKVMISPVIESISLAGLKPIYQDQNKIEYSYNGDINNLIHLVSKYHLDSFTITDMDLEGIFMHYYEKEEAHD